MNIEDADTSRARMERAKLIESRVLLLVGVQLLLSGTQQVPLSMVRFMTHKITIPVTMAANKNNPTLTTVALDCIPSVDTPFPFTET